MCHKYASVRTSIGSNVSGFVSDIAIGIVTYSTTLFISVVLFNLRHVRSILPSLCCGMSVGADMCAHIESLAENSSVFLHRSQLCAPRQPTAYSLVGSLFPVALAEWQSELARAERRARLSALAQATTLA